MTPESAAQYATLDSLTLYPRQAPTQRAILGGDGQLYPRVFLTKLAYSGGVQGIEAARQLFGPGP